MTGVGEQSSRPTPDVDVLIIGSGMGGLTTAADLCSKGMSVGVLERYLIPGGSGGQFERGPYRFDVGASMIFGLGSDGTTNLLTRALETVGQTIESIEDPIQVHYHLPNGLNVRTHRAYEEFIKELSAKFPKQRGGIRKFYDTCWSIFKALNAMPLKSLEEPYYLFNVFLQHPIACLTLARFVASNVGDFARKYIDDEELLKFIDMECYSWSVTTADLTPMINGGMVFCDRHYGGIRYPKGGVGRLAQAMVDGILQSETNSWVRYGARVTDVLFNDEGRAIGVQLFDGSKLYARAVVTNSTRWDTFDANDGLLSNSPQRIPDAERVFMQRYVKSPSFCSVHMVVRAADLRLNMAETECHHIILEDWADLETSVDGKGTLFVSIPTVLDSSLAPDGMHIFHFFTPSDLAEWPSSASSTTTTTTTTSTSAAAHGKGQYQAKKQTMLDTLLRRLEPYFPGISNAVEYVQVGSPKTHRRFLGRVDGSYGPTPAKRLNGLISMPFNRTQVPGLYCVGDSTFPGQGLNATAFSGFSCAHRVAADLDVVPRLPQPLDSALTSLLSDIRLKL